MIDVQIHTTRLDAIANPSLMAFAKAGATAFGGIPQAKIDLLAAWWETRLFSDAECAAIAYAEALTRASDTTVTRPAAETLAAPVRLCRRFRQQEPVRLRQAGHDLKDDR